MPVSKSRRKNKQPARKSPAPAFSGPSLELLLSDAMAKELDTESAIAELRARGQDFSAEKIEQAEDVVIEAWQSDDPARRMELAVRALKVCPWCGDAYGVLAENAPPNSDLQVHLWRLAVAAAEVALTAELGDHVFEAHAGDFWELIETRAYMRAQLGLAHALWNFGEREEAVNIDLEALRLNPNDNQGVRYVAACRLLMLGRDEELGKLLEEYREEDSAFLAFARTLWTFRREGDSETSRKLLADAIAANPYVPVYLLGRRSMPLDLPAFYGLGEEDEAVHYVDMAMEAWRSVPGALTWLSKRARMPAASPSGRLH